MHKYRNGLLVTVLVLLLGALGLPESLTRTAAKAPLDVALREGPATPGHNVKDEGEATVAPGASSSPRPFPTPLAASSPKPRPTPDAEPAVVRRTEVQLNFSAENVSRNNGRWRTASLDFKRDVGARRVLYGSLRAAERFNLRDQEAMGGIYLPAGKKWAVNLEASAGLGNRFLPRYSVYGEVERALPKGWVLHGGVRYTAFRQDRATTGNFTAEKYFGNYRAAYSLYVAALRRTQSQPGHRFQINRYYGEQSSTVGLSFAFGQDLENIGTRVLRSSFRSWAVTGTHWLNRHWGLNYQATSHRQGEFYQRKGGGFGLRFRF
jgi:YaiO family outer membrane protein